MAKELLINVSEGEECRIALLDGGKLEELYMERTSSTSHVGNIYKGRVTNVEPSIQAAFIDFGLGRNGFLHISDLMPTYFGRRGEDVQESVGRKMARRDRPPIQRCLRRGDEIVVQIIKEGIGTKGPTLTTYLSIPGKILVMMPGMDNTGVSRKIEDDEERRRLRQILDALAPPDDAGFIIRTAGIGATKAEIQRDLTYLVRLWTNFKKQRDSGPGPMELYTEGDLVTRTVRDVFTPEVDKLVIDHKDVAKRVKDVIKLSSPRTRNKVELYEDPIPLFTKYGIEREIEMMYSRHVPLPSGGSLVIDSTEAIVAIDVNSGKFRDHSDAETTAFKTDMEAADEICRQLKLRDLGGVIICDFIDLRYERHRRELEKRLHDNLKDDRAKTKVLRMSQFGIIEMTRQRMRPSFKRSVYFDCPHCKGAGLVKTPESMSLDVMRRLRIAINDLKVQRVELAVCPDVAFYLQNKKRQSLSDLEHQYDKRILIRSDLQLGLDEMKLDLFDNRDGLVVLESLGMLTQPPHTTQLGTRPQQFPHRGGGGGGGGRNDRGGRGGGGRRPEPQRQHAGAGGGGGPRHDDDELPEDRFEERGEGEGFDREPDYDEQESQQPQQPARAESRGGPQRDGRRGGGGGGGDPRDAQRGGRGQPAGRGGRGGGGGGDDRGDRRPHRSTHEEAEEAPTLDTEAGGEAADVTETVAGRRGSGPAAGEANGDGQGEEGGGGARRRRRRRRGRRGRGRNRQGAEGTQHAAGENGQYPADAGGEGQLAEGDDYASDDEPDRRDRVDADEESIVAEAVIEEDVIEADDRGHAPTGRERGEVDESREPSRDVVNEDEASSEEPGPAPTEVVEDAPAEAKPKRRRGARGGRGRGRKKPATTAADDAEPAEGSTGASTAKAEPAAEPAAATVRTGSTDRHLIEDEPAFPQPVRRPRTARDLDSIPDDFD